MNRPIPRLALTFAAALASWTCAVRAPAVAAPQAARSQERVLALADFEEALTATRPGGLERVRSTLLLEEVGGRGVARVPERGAVGLFRTPAGFDPQRGAVALRLRPGPPRTDRQYLLHLSCPTSLDGDGAAELIVGEPAGADGPGEGRVLFAPASGEGGAPAAATFASATPRGLGAADLDGDGWQDLVVAMNQSGEVQVFAGPITPGRRLEPCRVLAVPRPQGLSLADLDDDGDVDLLVASYDERTPPLLAFTNDGAGVLAPLDLPLGGAPAEATALGDVDGDGVLDVLYGSFHPTEPAVLLFGSRDGAGGWTVGRNEGGARFPSSALGAALADLDADGWLDVVLARPHGELLDETDSGEVMVWLGRGEGRFAAEADRRIPLGLPFTVSADRDLDHDGHLDLVVASWGRPAQPSAHSTVLFGPDFDRGLPFAVEDAVSFAVADLSGDGIEDLFWRSSRGVRSPLYLLGPDGAPLARRWIPTTECRLGMGSLATGGGSGSYGTIAIAPGGFELFVEHAQLCLAVTDRRGRRHSVSSPLPVPVDAGGEFLDLRAEWSGPQGHLALAVGSEGRARDERVVTGEPFEVAPPSPVFRLGTDGHNQRACRGWLLDQVTFESASSGR